jgi:hypothetical protein
MLAIITRIQSPINFLLYEIFICYSRCQIFELWHVLKGSLSYLSVMIFFCILVTRQQHIPRFSEFTSRPTSLLEAIKVSVFFFMVSMLSTNRFTSSAWTSSWNIPLNFSLTWFLWTFLMAYSKVKLKSSGYKASPFFKSFWIGKLSDRCLPIHLI